jgi:Uma2 family endonuclease
MRAEWVDGEVIMMAPVSDEHSDLDGWLLSLLRLFAEHHNLGLVRGRIQGFLKNTSWPL